nr:(R)-specific enoyl-CoA hydratase [Ipomoea batatas]
MRVSLRIYTGIDTFGWCKSALESVWPSSLRGGGWILLSAMPIDVVEYSKLSHDTNPLHFDSECAKLAGFSDRLVPGMLVASLFPRTIASNFALQFVLIVRVKFEEQEVIPCLMVKMHDFLYSIAAEHKVLHCLMVEMHAFLVLQ